MLNSEFNAFCKLPEQAAIDLYPESLEAEVDALNELCKHTLVKGLECASCKLTFCNNKAFTQYLFHCFQEYIFSLRFLPPHIK